MGAQNINWTDHVSLKALVAQQAATIATAQSTISSLQSTVSALQGTVAAVQSMMTGVQSNLTMLQQGPFTFKGNLKIELDANGGGNLFATQGAVHFNYGSAVSGQIDRR